MAGLVWGGGGEEQTGGQAEDGAGERVLSFGEDGRGLKEGRKRRSGMMSGERDHHCLAADESEFFFLPRMGGVQSVAGW